MLNSDRFPNGARKALTMSYDDGKTPDRRLVSIFNKYGIKGTFHLNAGLLGTRFLLMVLPISLFQSPREKIWFMKL